MKAHLRTLHILAFCLAVTGLSAPEARAEAEKCDPFTFAARGEALPVITVLKAGSAPVLSISGKLVNYDPAHHCFISPEKGVITGSCGQTQRVVSGGKTVAILEGSRPVKLFSVDARGNANRSGVYYQMSVDHDAYRKTQPRFWLEAVRASEQKVVGRFDAIDGLTIEQMKSVKAKIASAHKLIDISRSSAMYTNCRKLAVVPFDSRYYPTSSRLPASNASNVSLAMPPRPTAQTVARTH